MIALDRPLSARDRARACELFLGRTTAEDGAHGAAAALTAGELPYRLLEHLVAEPPPAEAAMTPTPTHVALAYRLILHRDPESAEVVERHVASASSTVALVESVFVGHEFRSRAVELIRGAVPSPRSVWHLHVPRTAGTTFESAFLEAGFAVVSATALAAPWISFRDLVAPFALTRLRHGVLFTGHQTLASVRPHRRPAEDCLAFVRHPVERIVSLFDFLATLAADPSDIAATALRPFLERGFDPRRFEQTCFETTTFLRNEQCAYLSPDATAAAALREAEADGVRLHLHADVGQVLRARFGLVPSESRRNASRRFVDPASLPRRTSERILAENAEDLALFDAVRGRGR